MKQHFVLNDHQTVIYSDTKPDAIEKKIQEIFDANKVEYTVDEKKYKIQFTYKSVLDE